MEKAEIKLINELCIPLQNFFISRGIPLPPGRIKNPGDVSVCDATGRIIPSEGIVLQRRPDRSIEWLLMDILVDLDADEKKSIFVEMASAPQPAVENEVSVVETRGSVVISNGISEITLSRTGPLVAKLVINGKSLLKDAGANLEVVDGSGKVYRASAYPVRNISVVRANRLCAIVRVEGKHAANDGATFLDYALEFTLTANIPDIKIQHTFYCREPIDGLVWVRSIRLVLDTCMEQGAPVLLRQANHGKFHLPRALELNEKVEVVSSSIGDIDRYAQIYNDEHGSHPLALGSVFIRDFASLRENLDDYPFYLRPGEGSKFRAEQTAGGLRTVYPVIAKKQNDFTLVVAFDRWQHLHPKSILIDGNLVIFSIWPQWSSPMKIVQGVSKSHILRISGSPGPLSMNEVEHRMLRWEYPWDNPSEPVDFSIDPAWPAHCEVLDCHRILKYQPDKYPVLENLIEPAVAAGNPHRRTYDRHPAYGMFHFGDTVAAGGASCRNNEDDVDVFFPLQHYLRTGQTYAFDYGCEAARHYIEVDFREWSKDPSQSGGLIPHTDQHFIGAVYASHQWTEGILAYYYLTGDERARNVVIKVGDHLCYWVLHHMNLICANGREAGMPMVNLAAAYRLTGDKKYLDAAYTIINSFVRPAFEKHGMLKYPIPFGAEPGSAHMLITGYGDWSTYQGLFRIWELSNDNQLRMLLVKLLEKAVIPENYNPNDARTQDYFSAWVLAELSGNARDVVRRLSRAIPMLLRKGGHPLRRLHFLKMLDDLGLLDDSKVGTGRTSI